eukprot:408046-Rhodomonas_salina.1
MPKQVRVWYWRRGCFVLSGLAGPLCTGVGAPVGLAWRKPLILPASVVVQPVILPYCCGKAFERERGRGRMCVQLCAREPAS